MQVLLQTMEPDYKATIIDDVTVLWHKFFTLNTAATIYLWRRCINRSVLP